MDKALVILSGGQDSTVCLYWAKKHYKEVHAITFNYGQKHSEELIAARRIVKMAGIASHTIINVPEILKSRSPLLDKSATLETYENFEQMDEVIGDRLELTFVPMRNAFFLTVAANHAIAMDCYNVVIGVCEADNANYPDCRKEYIEAQEQAINKSLGITNFKIETPLIDLTKEESVKLAKTLKALPALAYSHTCYANKYPPCGKCHSCLLREQGFKDAKVPDPLLKRVKDEATN